LECEELWWSQRSRVLWLQNGDKNTKYFHMKANIWRRKNRIEAITDSNGQIQYNELMIAQVFMDHFQHLFSSQETHDIADTVDVVRGRIIQDMFNMLSEKYTSDEVL
jgi:hypothetical protein